MEWKADDLTPGRWRELDNSQERIYSMCWLGAVMVRGLVGGPPPRWRAASDPG